MRGEGERFCSKVRAHATPRPTNIKLSAVARFVEVVDLVSHPSVCVATCRALRKEKNTGWWLGVGESPGGGAEKRLCAAMQAIQAKNPQSVCVRDVRVMRMWERERERP